MDTRTEVLFDGYEGRRLVEFAIYRLSPDAFERERKRIQQKYVEFFTPTYQQGAEPDNSIMRHASRATEEEHGEFAYNNIIAWARLVVTGIRRKGSHATIKGYYSIRESKRINRNSRARLAGSHKFTEFGIYSEESTNDIVSKIKTEVVSLVGVRTGPFAGRWVDFEPFDSIARWVDWHSLLEIKPGVSSRG